MNENGLSQLSFDWGEAGVEITPTGIDFSDGVTEETWLLLGKQLKTIGRSWQFWVGDWLRYGGFMFGKKYKTASAILGLDEKQLQQCNWVANKVAPENRMPQLSWTYHREVASLDPELQKECLNIAVEGKLATKEFRLAVKKKNPKRDKSLAEFCPKCGGRTDSKSTRSELKWHKCEGCQESVKLVKKRPVKAIRITKREILDMVKFTNERDDLPLNCNAITMRMDESDLILVIEDQSFPLEVFSQNIPEMPVTIST